ncbi:helix-turn-helix domain-containing protein [Streptomyces echinoruber]|uniref:helix-turn-helix domain-containing protein n=1 Tax=Streptomyces echinoruber TaxID=68898 RepID=UPI00227D7D4D|nr:helix-turn-helix domain-containing protein [Streptomyces echinoruber]
MTRSSMSADVVRLYRDGLSIRAAAAATGTSYNRARRALLDAGVTLRDPARLGSTLALADDCARLYRRGLSIRAVAGRVGYSYRYVRDLILAGGAELRDRAGRARAAS